MTGSEFESFVRTLFERLGYKGVRQTAASGDQGADLLCVSPEGKQAVIQTKRWKGPVGNSAIQEVFGALHYYDAEIAFVITNSSFTQAARALAGKVANVHLVDRAELMEKIRGVSPGKCRSSAGRNMTRMSPAGQNRPRPGGSKTAAKDRILADVAAGKLTVDEAAKQLAELKPARCRTRYGGSQKRRRRY